MLLLPLKSLRNHFDLFGSPLLQKIWAWGTGHSLLTENNTQEWKTPWAGNRSIDSLMLNKRFNRGLQEWILMPFPNHPRQFTPHILVAGSLLAYLKHTHTHMRAHAGTHAHKKTTQITVLWEREILGKGRKGLKKAERKTFGAMPPGEQFKMRKKPLCLYNLS